LLAPFDIDKISANVLGVALLPLIIYLLFALSSLLVEILRAILRIPARIDALRADVNGGPPAAG